MSDERKPVHLSSELHDQVREIAHDDRVSIRQTVADLIERGIKARAARRAASQGDTTNG